MPDWDHIAPVKSCICIAHLSPSVNSSFTIIVSVFVSAHTFRCKRLSAVKNQGRFRSLTTGTINQEPKRVDPTVSQPRRGRKRPREDEDHRKQFARSRSTPRHAHASFCLLHVSSLTVALAREACKAIHSRGNTRTHCCLETWELGTCKQPESGESRGAQ